MRLRTILVMLVAQLGGLCFAQAATTQSAGAQPNALGIIVGPDTTRLTGPLLPDGSVDYVAAINAIESRGVTPRNNAACILLRLTDAGMNQPPYIRRRIDTLKLIGAQIHPADEIAWQPWPGFANPTPTDDPQSPTYVDRFSQAETRPWSGKDMPDLTAWLTSNDAALAVAQAASQRSRFWLPIVMVPGDNASLPLNGDVSLWRGLAQALCIRGMSRLHERDTSGALQDLLTLQRLGSLIGQSPELLVALTGSGMESLACQASWTLLGDSRIPAAALRRWSADLTAMTPIPVPPTGIVRRAHFDALHMVQVLAAVETAEMLKHMSAADLQAAMAAAAKASIPVLDWNRILRLVNSIYDDLEKDRSALPAARRAAEEQAVDDRIKQFEQLVEAGPRLPSQWLLPQPGETSNAYSDRVGANILMMQLPSFRHLAETFRQCDQRVDWTAKVGMALAIYRLDHGEYPVSLDALVPAYLPRLPDNTSAYPIGYERRGPAYVIRYVKVYDAREQAQLAEMHRDYEYSDIIIATDEQ